jgi:N6-adenosine-specific RNA methylase IME4
VKAVHVDSIRVGERHRKDLGDIEGLARSINEIGLLHPIVVRPDGTLIAGERRLAACRLLGWQEVPVTVIDLENVVKGERDENMARKDFTPSEAVAIWQAMEASRPGPKDSSVINDNGTRRIDRASEATGMGTATLSRAKQVVEAAEREPERFGDLLEQMDSTGNVSRAYKELKREQVREQNRKLVQAAEPITRLEQATYQTIVLDPPWDWGDEGDADQLGRARPTYATMPIDEIAALPVGSLAADNAHLYLWITNRSLPKGFGLLDRWGFRYVTMLTWVKPSIGMGNYFRGSTEQVLFGVRGSLGLLRADVGTHFLAPRPGQHSAKPDAFYQLVESCSPGPWLEMFARSQRNGWAVWGAEA